MKLRVALLASAVGLLSVGVPSNAVGETLEADAAAFGAREAVERPDLSADGSSIVYITPATGRKSIAMVGNLDTGKFTQMVGSDGEANKLRWCNFVSATRSVCWITGLNKEAVSEIIGFSRLVSLNTDGSDAKQLGQSESAYDAYLRQFDASVVDWLQGTDNKILLERQYVPEEFKLNTRLVRTKRVSASIW